MDIGARILQLRKQIGVTQQQLADYLLVSPQTVSRWEANGGTPEISLLPKIAVFFGITLDELFGMGDVEQLLQLVMRYSILRDEKSFEDAMNAVVAGEKKATDEYDDEKRKQLKAYRMHLLLQKSNQMLREADELADQLIAETPEESDPLHLPVRLQKMSFDIHNGNVVERLKQSERDFSQNPNMESFQIYARALLETGQGERTLYLYTDSFVRNIITSGGSEALCTWEILFEAAKIVGDLEFFEKHFDEFESLTKTGDSKLKSLEVRKMLAELYAENGMEEKKESCKMELIKELESNEELKRQELFYQRYLENIRSI